MRFDADRLARLAGLAPSGARTLTEASNRSMHDDAAVSDEADWRFGKNQLAEGGEEGPEILERGESKGEESDTDPGDEDYTWRGKRKGKRGRKDEDLDEVIEIDEGMLRKEILRMRRQRQQNLDETKVRKVIRREIREMMENSPSDLEDRVYNDASWVYGDNKPRRSRRGQITMGALGIGFK